MEGSGRGSGQGSSESAPPPVSLPFVSDSAGGLPTAVAAPGALAASDDELGEDDLFGSEGEDAGAAPRRTTDTIVPSAGSGTNATPIPDERDLFGEDSDAGELDEKALFGSEEEGGAEIDERELFGSEDEEGASKQPALRSEPRTPVASELSEMDEREIFGDVSDDEPEKVEDIILRRRPGPGEDREFVSMKLPNVISIEKNAYGASKLPAAAMDGHSKFKNTANKQATRLLNPENCVRWRFKKGPDGHNMTDEDGRPQYESNARFVEWEDGSKTLYVGKEAFNIMEIDDRIFLFEENSQDVHVCHGDVNKRFLATPQTLKSTTHTELKKTQFKTFEPTRRSLLMSQEEQDANQALQELQTEHKQRQKRDEQKQKRTADAGGGEMTAAFLEDDQPSGMGFGPSVMDIKQQAKKQRSS